MSFAPLWLLTNAASGSYSAAAVEELSNSLAAAGCAPAREIRFPAEDLPTREVLDQAGVATLAVFTGDGTINAAACAIEGWGGAVLVLPGGTQNLLAKSLHGDAAAEAITSALASARKQRRQAIRTSQGTALIELLAGPGAMWADVREGVRDFDLGAIAETFGKALSETREAPGVRVALPQVGRDVGYRAVRLDCSGERMLAEGYDFADWGQFAAQGFAMLVKRDFRQGPHDELGRFDAVTLKSEAPIALMIDGERREGGREERVTCGTFALDFIATAPSGT